MNPLTIHRPSGHDRAQLGRWVVRGGKRLFSPTCGRGMLVSPEGDILWLGEWVDNALHDEGEKSMLDVYFKALTNPDKYGFLCNQGGVTEITDTNTMASGITESETPGTHGYNRQQYATTDWGTPALDSGDMMTTGVEKTFGPNSDAGAWTVSHVGITTASTGTGGLLIITTPLSAQQTVAQNISFKWTQKVKTQ